MTWQRGREIMTMRRTDMEGTLLEFVDTLPAQHVTQVAGTAIYPHLAEGTAPLALRLNVEHNHVLHRHVIVVSARTADVPHTDAAGDPADRGPRTQHAREAEARRRGQPDGGVAPRGR